MAILTIEELADYFEKFEKADQVRLFLIERVSNDGKAQKNLGKYSYIPFEVDLDNQAGDALFGMVRKGLASALKRKPEITQYEIISDDTHQIFTNPESSKIKAFNKLLDETLEGVVPKIEDVAAFTSIKKIWAIGLKFFNLSTENSFYAFRKVSETKVLMKDQQVKVAELTDKKILKRIEGAAMLNLRWDLKEKKLTPFEGFSLSVEKSIDLVCIDGEKYIFQKSGFESLVGAADYIQEQAEKASVTMESKAFINGFEHVKSVLKGNTNLMRKFLRVLKNSVLELENADILENIKAQEELLKRGVKVKDDMVQVENEEEVEEVIRYLSDYYKTGLMTRKTFGTYSGKVIPG